ncbi:uncharacterized protein TNCV_4678622 [Trichonephila clavipes]|nr:uncharacterized protein TNCV_4678622 [Trichonephila clavipes]
MAAGCQSMTRWVQRGWIMERFSKESKQRKGRVKIEPPRTKTGKVKRSYIGVAWKLRKWGVVQNYEICHQYPRIAFDGLFINVVFWFYTMAVDKGSRNFESQLNEEDDTHVASEYYFNKQSLRAPTLRWFNGDRYRAMITNFFIPELNNHDVQELWFQQDGAACHTARATIDLLKDSFGDDRLISRFGPVNWPPRSCDLTPLDYFLWGYVKSLVCADKPQTLDHLEDNIRRVIADIRPQMLEKGIENWTSRLDYIRASRGSHMPEIIFKM